MAAESAFLTAVQTFLSGAGLQPAPATIGGAEPSAQQNLSAVVLSLEATTRAAAGLGERLAIKVGALPWAETVDLATLFDKQLSLDRLKLYLPHGALVRSDGSDDPLQVGDITIKVNNVAQTLVAANPAAGQFSVNGAEGLVTFGAALPNPPATVNATYFVGQWEQRLVRIHGVLRVDICGKVLADVNPLALAVMDALLSPAARAAIVRLLVISVSGMTSIGVPQVEFANSRRQTIRFQFDFEQEINRPESGGVIHLTPVITRLVSTKVEPGDVIVETMVQEPPRRERRSRMSETIGEMILPGTYIEVRAEGLIGVGGIATGNVGIVGSASRGPLESVRILGSYTEALDTFGNQDPLTATNPLTLVRGLEQLFMGGASTVYAVRVAVPGMVAMASSSWKINDVADATLFTLTATSPGTWGESITVAFDSAASSPTLVLTYARQKETFTGANAKDLSTVINEGSKWVVASKPAGADEAKVPAKVAKDATGGPDGANLTSAEIKKGLDVLAGETVNIITVPGLDAKVVGGVVSTHLDATESDGRERIAVLGAWSDDPTAIDPADLKSGPRMIVVAPGIVNSAGAVLKASYSAAVVAGKLASIAPHVSLTNKDVPSTRPAGSTPARSRRTCSASGSPCCTRTSACACSRATAPTTAPSSRSRCAASSTSPRPACARAATRTSARLNNARIRAALKATLDGFLSGMVLDEMLIGYELDVSATRAQEIAGQAVVTMTLQPTFSIDFVKVIMNLQ